MKELLHKRSWLVLGILLLISGLFIIISPNFLSTSTAAPTTSTWTTKGDFENNASTTNTPTTRTDVKVTGSASTDNADVMLRDPYLRIATTIPVNAAEQMAINSTTHKTYISCWDGSWTNHYVAVINNATNTKEPDIPVGAYSPIQLTRPAVNEQTNEIYVADLSANNNVVWVINGNTNQITDTITVGHNVAAVAVNQTLNKIYATNTAGNSVSVIDRAQKKVIKTVAVGNYPGDLAVYNNKVYVVNQSAPASVSVIRCSDDTVVQNLPVGNVPFGIVANPTTNRVYVANLMSKSVSVIDATTDQIIQTITGTYYPNRLACDPVGNKIYVGMLDVANTTTVLDGNTHARLPGLDFYVDGADWINSKLRLYAVDTTYGVVNVAYDAYPALGTVSGLKINAGATTSWKTISWNAATPANTSVKFRVRGADTEGGLASANWSDEFESGADLTRRVTVSKWLELEARLISSDGASTPTLHDFTVNYEPVTLTSRDCSTCHGTKYPSDQFDQYSETNNVVLSSCAPCHKYYRGHGGANWPNEGDPASYGWFQNADSPYASGSTIHTPHLGSAYQDTDASCARCHHPADCNTCHQNSVPHGTHGPVTPVTLEVSKGGLTSPPYNKDFTCLNAKCHNIAVYPTSTLVLTPACSNCHTVGGKEGHGNITPIHTYSTMTTSCRDCHSNILTTEHASRGHDCWTCHGDSASQTVKDAIANHDRRCTGTGACHGGEEGKMSGPLHNPHINYNTFSNLCRACHKVHQAQGKKITRKASEIEICYICHDGSGSTYDIRIRSGYEGLAAHDTHLTAPAASNIKCLNCHHPHGATAWPNGGIRMTRDKEESLCYGGNPALGNCHGNTTNNNTSGLNIYQEFQKTSHHLIENSNGASSRVECSSCHGPHTVKETAGQKTTDPANTYKFMDYDTSGVTYCNTCHKQAPWPTQIGTSDTFVPYDISFPTMDASTGNPFFPGWNKTAYNNVASPSTHYASSMPCSECHVPHGSDYLRLTKFSENNACVTCHMFDGSTIPNIKAPLQKLSHHPTLTTDGVHRDTESSSGLGTGKRHAECADCHDAHEAKKGTHALGTNTTSPVLAGVKGLAVANNPGSITFFPTNPNQISFEYQLCFKCHSSYTTGYTGGDKAAEFNTFNPSYHPIEDGGQNSGIHEEAFKQGTPWNPTAGDDGDYNTATSLRVTCTDCHGNNDPAQAKGPHGSVNPKILIAPNPGSGVNMKETDLCFICHDYYTYGYYGNDWRLRSPVDGFVINSRWLTQGNWDPPCNPLSGHVLHISFGEKCSNCHLPHGSTTNKHLLRTELQYVHKNPGDAGFPNGGGTMDIKLNTKGGTCRVVCHVGPIEYKCWYP